MGNSALTETINISGTIVQTVGTEDGAVATGTTTAPNDNTIPQNTEGDEYMSVSITPTLASSVLLVDVVVIFAHSAVLPVMTVALFKDSIANALACCIDQTMEANGSIANSMSFSHRISAGSTSAQTFKVRIGADIAGTTTFNGTGGGATRGGVLSSSIRIMEQI